MHVRLRFGAAIFGVLGFTFIGSMVSSGFLNEWWFWVGVGSAVSAVFLEPYVTRPQDAIYNSFGGMIAYLTAPRAELTSMWSLYGVFWASIFLLALFSALTRDPGKIKRFAFVVSSQAGRAKTLGATSLLLQAASLAAGGQANAYLLAVAAAVLLVPLSQAFLDLFVRKPKSSAASCRVEDVVGPRMLRVSGSLETIAQGAPILMTAGDREMTGSLVAHVPAEGGNQALVLLERDWSAGLDGYPREVEVRQGEQSHSPMGVISAGSDPLQVHLIHTDSRLEVGSTLATLDAFGSRTILYQVSDIRLQHQNWSNTKLLESEATALQLGYWDQGKLRVSPQLPGPHAGLIMPSNSAQQGTLPESHIPLGTVKGTNLPVGIATAQSARGHVAIMGVSGMGKTTAAHTVLQALGVSSQVSVLDTTGEYRSRLGVPPWSDESDGVGAFVFEPNQDAVSGTTQFVSLLMARSRSAYLAGTTTISRVILLEEAHSLIPEWNFASRGDQDNTNITSRHVLEARKLGVSFIVVSQRTALVTKSVLAQCETYIVFKTLDDTSLSYYEQIVGSIARSVLPALGRHEALCFGPGINSDGPVVVSMSPPIEMAGHSQSGASVPPVGVSAGVPEV